MLDFPGESIDCVGVCALVHRLADESECIGKFVALQRVLALRCLSCSTAGGGEIFQLLPTVAMDLGRPFKSRQTTSDNWLFQLVRTAGFRPPLLKSLVSIANF